MKRFAWLLVLLLLFTGCSARPSSSSSYEADMETPQETPTAETTVVPPDGNGITVEGAEGQATSQITVTDPNRKLVHTASLWIETTDFNNSVTAIEALCNEKGGYIEGATTEGRSLNASQNEMRTATYLFRVPTSSYEGFLRSVGDIGNVTQRQEGTEDITSSYYDTQTRLQVLEMRRDRLVELLEKTTDSKAIVDFENSLTDTLYEIDRMTGTLQRMNDLVSYAKIEVTLQEVVVYQDVDPVVVPPKTVGERISAQFQTSLETLGTFFVTFFVLVAGNILYLLLWGAVITGIVLLTLRLVNGKKKPMSPSAPTPQPPVAPLVTPNSDNHPEE